MSRAIAGRADRALSIVILMALVSFLTACAEESGDGATEAATATSGDPGETTT